jgi:rhamnosyltransferase
VGVDVRILVRDDGSTDSTRALVQSAAQEDARISLCPDHRPTGSASANFFALMALADPLYSSFDYVAFCDQDDEWLPNKLRRAAAQLRAHAAAGYSATVLAQWDDGRTVPLTQFGKARRSDYLFEGAGQGCSFLIEAGKFARVQNALAAQSGLLPALHYHDWAVHAILRSTGERWVFDAEPALRYRQHEGNDTGARNSGAGVARRLELIRSGWYRSQVAAIVELVLRLNPYDAGASEWRRLDSPGARATLSARWSRLIFVVRHGRRRLLDRMVLVAAVLLGYL